MKKIVRLLLPALFFCGTAVSQVLLPQSPKDYGKRENRVQVLKALHIPMKTLEILSSDTSAQIFYNPLDSSIWAYSLSKNFFRVSGSATDTSSLSIRINEKLNTSDTSNKWLATVYKRNDSVFFKKGNVETFAYKDSIGSGGGSTDTSHLSARIDDRAKFVDVKDTIQKVLDYMVLNSISDFTTFNKYSNSVIVKDSNRGGTFTLYTGSDPADGGMTFSDALGRKWRRQVDESEPINVKWFGFVADGTTDNYANFLALKTWLVNHRVNSDAGNPAYTYFARLRPIYFPAAFNYYKFSQTLNFEHSCTILGAPNWSSKLLFPADSVGIALWWVDQYATGTSSVYNLIQDIALYATIDGTYDTTAIGIKVRSPSNIIHVSVENFGGAGLDFNSTDPITSNTDFCRVVDCRAYYNLDGMYVKGGEANVIRVYDCDFSINRRWGVYDRGFLGNFYYNCHSAVNGVVTAGQYTFVIHRTGGIGIRYQYAAKRNGYLTMPGDSTGWENDWILVGDSTKFHNGYAPDYIAGTHYWQGGSYYIETGMLMNCYDEGGQMGRYLGLYATSLFGINGAATSGDKGFQWNSIGVFQSSYGKSMNLNLPGSSYTVGEIGFNYSKLTEDALTFYKSSTGQGLEISFDTTFKMGKFKDLGTGTSRTLLTSLAANPVTYGRTSFLEGSIFNTHGSYIGSFDDSKATLIVYGTTIPASGTWSVGDLVIKKNISTADVWGWRCITAGTPGTWESLSFTHVDSVTSKWSSLGNFGTANAWKLGTKDNTLFNIITNNTNRVTVQNDGRIQIYNNVAIGATPPSYGYIFDILESGTINTRVGTTTAASSGGRAILNFTEGTGSASTLPGWRIGLNASAENNSDFMFDELNSGTFVQRWKVQKNTGYFGINKTSPAFRLHVGGKAQIDSTLWITTETVSDSSDKAASTAFVKDAIAASGGGGGGGGGATAGQLRRFGSSDVTGTDANITAAAGTVLYLPAATLSTNRTIDVASLNTDGDYIEIYNSEAGFTWSFTGATVYLLDRTTTASTLVVDGVYKIRRVSGKLIINN